VTVPARVFFAARAADVALFAAAALLFALTGVRARYNGLLADSYVYVAAAEQFGRLDAADTGLLRHVFEAYPFPPLFPLLLGLAGGGADNPAWTFGLCALALAAAVLLFQRWLCATGAPLPLAVATAFVFALLPVSLHTAMGVLSEPPFMALLLGAALLLASRRPSATHWYVAALLVGLCPLVRTVGVVAVAAFLACWALRRAWRLSPLAPLPALFPLLAWRGVKTRMALDGYPLTHVLDRDVPAQLAQNLGALAHHGLRSVDTVGRDASAWLLAAIALVAVAVLVRRALRAEFDALLVLAYLPVLLLWPYPDHAARLLYVVMPFVLAHALLGATALATRYAGPRRAWVGGVLPALLFVLVLPGSGPLLRDLWTQRAGEEALLLRAPASLAAGRGALRASRFEARLDAFMQRHLREVPPDACVASIVPQRVLLYGALRGVDLANVVAAGGSLDAALVDCPYVLMVAALPFPRVRGIDGMYPFRQVSSRMEVIAFERDVRDDPQSPLVAMLARVR
jgi:hypothetical protein